MKKYILRLLISCFAVPALFSQTLPTTGNGNANSDFWSRSGNNQTTGGNVFGTRWNSPIYTWTGGPNIYRSKLNGY